MSGKKYKGEISNFWKLLSKHKIEIPIIQRDYAQGRKDKSEIRENFLRALSQSLEFDKPIKLDFIYGSQHDGVSQPLDGQQRLTTLFLLHWYAAVKCNELNQENIEVLKRFAYETRISSRDFCGALVANKVNIENQSSLSERIIDSSWFFLSWKKDPTIDSMLRTIDDIHKYFSNIDNLWAKLTSEICLISFYYIKLEDIGLTDDLYIKMNARGKLLSPFENFKASFQKSINDNGWDEDKNFSESFALKIDSTWTDLFWKFSPDNHIDNAFIRFISTISMCRQVIRKTDNRLSIIKKLNDEPNSVKPELFNKDDFDYLCESLDAYYRLHKDNLDLKTDFPLFQHQPADTIFTAIGYEGQNASYTQKTLFYAQTEYLMKATKFDFESYQDWMRVVRNIICRGDVEKSGNRPAITRSQATFDGVINLIHELSNGCENIYKYLADTPVKSSFAKEQVEEERLKAQLIMFNSANRGAIFKTEDTNLLQGKISFALYCMNFDRQIEKFGSESLLSIQKVINEYFNKDLDMSNDLRRALLTIADDNGNYNYYGYWWSFWNVVSANKRCLLDNSLRGLEFYIYGKNSDEFRSYIKKLIRQLIDTDLKNIVESFVPPHDMPNWKVRLIKEPELLDNKCKSNHTAIPDDNKCCYLLKSMRPRDIDGCEKIE